MDWVGSLNWELNDGEVAKMNLELQVKGRAYIPAWKNETRTCKTRSTGYLIVGEKY